MRRAKRPQHGVDGVIVSNHGGRQLDGAAGCSTCCRPWSRRSTAALPSSSTAACAAARTWSRRWRSARTPASSAARSFGASRWPAQAGVAHVLEIYPPRDRSRHGALRPAHPRRHRSRALMTPPEPPASGTFHLGPFKPEVEHMIEDPPLLQIRRTFRSARAPKQVEAFRGLQTGFVVDAMNGRGASTAGSSRSASRKPFCGVALPCQAGRTTISRLSARLSIGRAGDVILCATDSLSTSSVMGDLLLGMMKNCGVVAFVTDGFVRDLQGIRVVGLPCFAAGLTPNSPAATAPARSASRRSSAAWP